MISLAPNKPKKGCSFIQIENTAFEHAPQVERVILILYATPPMENHRGPTPNEKFHLS
jgi:hypothetical protein